MFCWRKYLYFVQRIGPKVTYNHYKRVLYGQLSVFHYDVNQMILFLNSEFINNTDVLDLPQSPTTIASKIVILNFMLCYIYLCPYVFMPILVLCVFFQTFPPKLIRWILLQRELHVLLFTSLYSGPYNTHQYFLLTWLA